MDEDTPLGTAGPIGLIDISKIKKTLLVINGDIITNLNFKSFYNFHKSKNASITVAVKEYVLESRYGTIETNLDKISKIKEKPKYKNLISTGIYLIEKETLKNFPEGKIDMPDFINNLISEDKKIVYYNFSEKWTPIEEIEDIKEAELTT